MFDFDGGDVAGVEGDFAFGGAGEGGAIQADDPAFFDDEVFDDGAIGEGGAEDGGVLSLGDAGIMELLAEGGGEELAEGVAGGGFGVHRMLYYCSMSAMPSTTLSTDGPVWGVAELFPNQGEWSELQYLELTRNARRQVEFTDGCIELLAMPTKKHQKLVWWLARQVEAALGGRGEFVTAPYKLRVRAGKYREPDLLAILPGSVHEALDDYATGADLVFEVVSPVDPSRDYDEKRTAYAEAAVGEYWIVDPKRQLVTVLKLTGGVYGAGKQFGTNSTAVSELLPGLSIDVKACFSSAES